MHTIGSLGKITDIIDGCSDNPSRFLGPHPVEASGMKSAAVRAYLPGKEQAWLFHPGHGQNTPMEKIHPAGLFEATCPMDGVTEKGQYQLRIDSGSGQMKTMHDPYAFPSFFTGFDLHLLGEGKHWTSYEKMGAHPRTVNGVTGINFAVWAPNARSVSVVGDFNDWDARSHQMNKVGSSGIWELFIPDMAVGEKYKYRVRQADRAVDKCDPYGFAAEMPPRTASVVADLSVHQWQDQAWMERRANEDQLSKPMSVYEVHLGSWARNAEEEHGWFNYRHLAHELVKYCKQQNHTHIELMPISEHPFTGSWGYQTVGYYAATSRYGTPEDFMYFVDYCHQNDLAVILDWVPAHFPKDDHGLRRFDGTALYEHEDPRRGEHPDWGTLIFNYGRNEVRNFLVSNALFLFDKYHIDGLRVDAVASMLYLDYSREHDQWIPNQYGGRENLEAISFLKEFNEQSHLQHPGVVTIAEESTAWGGVSRPTYDGGLGFSLKWNMGWMNDTLRYMRKDPIYRQHHHGELTFSLIYAFTENFVLPLSHDEVVHGKGSLLDQMPGDMWQRFANLRLLFSYMWTHPGKKLLFMGGEIAQWNEWNLEAGLQWDLLEWESHQGMQKLISDLNAMLVHEPALHEVDFTGDGFEWIDCNDWQNSVITYVRKGKNPDDFVLVACNFTPNACDNYRMGVPTAGNYREVFNSDNSRYAGSDVINTDEIASQQVAWNGRENSIQFRLPPLGTVVFRPQR
ncbi:1,4-alpha-glucan branching protein GlgB [Bremerella cremea]|uniref:1,4-alpha-glucan branching enzyme GlgB n=1 Tax=Blastopirellula marina TaxID=124 RepID=A0A2S8FED0_9BACT|nr:MULTISPECIES: 1,4-alpha-glucan branching protein GlgB [Pirellulaceae]PQO30440.1 1,4-alpha-glucan branching enzyme [Blastopirellula marina]RCS43793.1 1,4-alpha-glucan branching protein GlgB [Bremerella cremea]